MSDSRSYRPGDWFGIFGEHATVVLPPSEKGRVAAIWALVDDGAGFDEVLDALISGGLRDLPGFVLVSEDGEETKVVVRGAARAEFTTADDTVVVGGSSATTWAEKSLTGVRAMRIHVAESEGVDDIAIGDGLVRIARTDRPAYAEPSHSDAWPSGDTGERAAVEHDGHTQAGNWDPGDFARSQPGIPGQPPAPSVLAAPVARLTFSSGEVVDVDRAVVVGRAPEARRFTSTEQPRLITVPSPNQEISSTHLEIRPGAGADHGSAVVTDLGSTNGTVLVQPGLSPENLQPGIAVQLIPGAVIDLGDSVTIQVGNG